MKLYRKYVTTLNLKGRLRAFQGWRDFAYYTRSHPAHSLRRLSSIHSENRPDFLPCIEYSLRLHSTQVVHSFRILHTNKIQGGLTASLYFMLWWRDSNPRPSG